MGVRIPHGPPKRRSYAILLQNGIAAILYFLYNSLLNNLSTDKPDRYFILKDFRSYAQAQEQVEARYRDEKAWAKSAILNVAHSGKFTSDRTIQEYVDDIWHLDKVTLPKETPVKKIGKK